MYKLIFEKKALNNLNKIDSFMKKRIWDKLQECKEDPFRYLKPLNGIDSFKLRVGNYRLIIDVKEEVKILNVLKIGHRRNVYHR